MVFCCKKRGKEYEKIITAINYRNARPDSETVVAYGLTNPGTLALTFSYDDIYMEASCNSTSVSGGDAMTSVENLRASMSGQDDEDIDVALIQLANNFNYVTRPSNTFTRGSNGDVCWCRVYGYKPTNETMQSTTSARWIMLGDCDSYCVSGCGEFLWMIPGFRTAAYGQ